MFPLSPLFPGWFELYRKTKKMVDHQFNLDLWLQDASLFRDEPIDSINVDDFFSTEKADTEGKQTALIQTGLDWFDEKVDLSVLNNPDSLLVHRNETQPSMEDDTAFLLGLLDSSFNPSYFASDVFKNEEIDFSKSLDTPNYVPEPASSEILDTHLASPQCNLLQVNSPFFVQSPASTYSDISEAPEETSSTSLLQSPESSTVTSDSASHGTVASEVVRVTVCDAVASPASSELALSIEEVSHSVRKRKFVNNGGEIPKVKVVITEYPRSNSTPKPKDRRERKKVQNKEAAARYRIKKRMEEKELSDEVESLESRQKELQEKHDNLKSEIKYLKSLMCEILQKKGILK